MYTCILLLPRLALLGATVALIYAGVPWYWPLAFFLAFIRGLGCPQLP